MALTLLHVSTRGPSLFQEAYQVVTPVKRKSWKAMMDAGRDPRGGTCPSLGLIVSWLLLAETSSITYNVHVCMYVMHMYTVISLFVGQTV